VLDFVREIFETIVRQRLRALATAFGVFWGIFMLTLLLAGGRGLRNGIDGLFADTAADAVWISSGRTARTYEGLGVGRSIRLTIEDVEALTDGLPELSAISPRVRLAASAQLVREDRVAAVPTFGIGRGYLQADRVRLRDGRELNGFDHMLARKVVMLGDRTRGLLFEERSAIGRTITIGGIEFDVVGVFADKSDGSGTLRAYMPYSTLARSFDSSGQLEAIAATVRAGARSEIVRKHASRLLAQRHRFAPGDPGALHFWFAEEEQGKVRQVLRGIDAAILVVGLGTLLSGMIGVSNILFVAVRERSKEFALRRALGASARSILRMVLAEAVFLSCVSGVSGLTFGLALVELARDAKIDSEYFRNPSVDLQAACFSLLLLIGSALAAGYYPAREAARAQPIHALRRE
jgi:putative ABC transport system permease protein